jgi:hypothetical protein
MTSPEIYQDCVVIGVALAFEQQLCAQVIETCPRTNCAEEA